MVTSSLLPTRHPLNSCRILLLIVVLPARHPLSLRRALPLNSIAFLARPTIRHASGHSLRSGMIVVSRIWSFFGVFVLGVFVSVLKTVDCFVESLLVCFHPRLRASHRLQQSLLYWGRGPGRPENECSYLRNPGVFRLYLDLRYIVN